MADYIIGIPLVMIGLGLLFSSWYVMFINSSILSKIKVSSVVSSIVLACMAVGGMMCFYYGLRYVFSG